jgi:hypothetical protein
VETFVVIMPLPQFKKESPPDFSKPENQQAFLLEAHNAAALLQKEIDVNQAEQDLLSQRIRMMKEFINQMPASDPQYSLLITQAQMDQIELDELKRREGMISEQLKKLKKEQE